MSQDRRQIPDQRRARGAEAPARRGEEEDAPAAGGSPTPAAYWRHYGIDVAPETSPRPASAAYWSHYGIGVQARLRPSEAQRDPDEVRAAADEGTSGAGGALPHVDRIQRSFGRHEVMHVKAHLDAPAAAAADKMGALAFAVGEHVAFGGAPDLHTAAHEAAHVVQQRAGVHLKSGVGEAGDAYERHADEVADRVVRGESAEALLDRHAGAGGRAAIQRVLKPTRPADGVWTETDTGDEYEVDLLLATEDGMKVKKIFDGKTKQPLAKPEWYLHDPKDGSYKATEAPAAAPPPADDNANKVAGKKRKSEKEEDQGEDEAKGGGESKTKKQAAAKAMTKEEMIPKLAQCIFNALQTSGHSYTHVGETAADAKKNLEGSKGLGIRTAIKPSAITMALATDLATTMLAAPTGELKRVMKGYLGTAILFGAGQPFKLSTTADGWLIPAGETEPVPADVHSIHFAGLSIDRDGATGGASQWYPIGSRKAS